MVRQGVSLADGGSGQEPSAPPERAKHVPWTALERTGVDCPTPALLGPAPPAVRSCSRLVEAELDVARAARTSIDTWDTHVHHMDMLRMGTLSPEKATDMWLAMWRRGVRDLGAYRAATRNPSLEVECPGSGTAG